MGKSRDMFMEERESSMIEMFNRDYPVSKSTIEQQAIKAVDIILESGSPVNAAQLLKSVESFVEIVRKDKRLVDFVRDELAKSSGKVTLASGTRIEAAEVGTEYNYENCGDSVWYFLQHKKEAAISDLKIREAFLKTIPAKGLIVTDELTGETTTIYPPTKTSISSYKVTLAR